MLTTEQLDDLRGKLEAATPGPWRAGRADMVTYFPGEDRPGKAIYAVNNPDCQGVMRCFGDACIDTAQAVAAFMNSAPSLLALAELGLKAKAFLEEHGIISRDALLFTQNEHAAEVADKLEELLESSRSIDKGSKADG